MAEPPLAETSRQYRPADTLVTVLTLLLVANLIGFLSAVSAAWMQVQLLNGIAVGEVPPMEVIEASDGRHIRIIWEASIVLLILTTVVVFFMWVYRSNSNARALGAEGMRFTPGWSVGWFFIPIMNLFRPFQVVKEIWLASNPATAQTPRDWQYGASSAILGLWWAAGLITLFLLRLADRLILTSNDLDRITTGATIGVVGYVVGVLLCVFAIMVVRGIHARQSQKHLMLNPSSDPLATASSVGG